MDAMAAHMSSAANPAYMSQYADVPLLRQRARALDGMWYSHDEFLDMLKS